ncbi:MAG: oligosaccharide repeat unit polymerase [Ruminococcus flavefaciens]|nr:oligosaccharide repeat unit polymerase [Ruminococcus flavefaciens]
MFQLIIMLVFLLTIFFIALKSTNFIFDPTIGFLAGFLLQVCFCIFYAEEWSINLSFYTVLSILLGALIFILVSAVLNRYRVKFVLRNNEKRKTESLVLGEMENVSNFTLLCLMMFQAVTLFMYISFMDHNMQGGSIADKIYYYRSMTADYGMVIKIPTILSFCRLLSSAIGYVLSYKFAYNMVHKINDGGIYYVLNLILSSCIGGMLGARGEIVNFAGAVLVEYFVIKKINSGINLSFKQLCKIFLVGIIALLFFPVLGRILGRPSTGIWYELAIYIGAPLKNFDTFLLENTGLIQQKHFTLFTQFFRDISAYVPLSFDINEQIKPLNQWRSVNGHILGNVYSIYANFWLDMGVMGIIIGPALEAFMINIFYRKIINFDEKDTKQINIWIIMYAYFFMLLAFSFFCNKFINQLFSLYTLKFFISVFGVKFLLEKIRWRSR